MSSTAFAILLFCFSLTFKIINSMRAPTVFKKLLKLTLTFSNKILDFWLDFSQRHRQKNMLDPFYSCINELNPQQTILYLVIPI